ncbi:MAG: hypothetical protein RL748_3151 [Pseudomonadota bacterium]|jgi:DNA-binding transcriptional LysR family regulator
MNEPMNLADLRMFLAVTHHASLQDAAQQLHVTPSALSKAIRRLEHDLRTPLFDRSGKALRLNLAGQRLSERALALLHLADQTRAEFEGADFRVRCRVAAPALLQWRFAGSLVQALTRRYQDSSLIFRPAWEDDALQALLRGEVDFALVTAEVLKSGTQDAAIEAVALGSMTMQLAAGQGHPLLQSPARKQDEKHTENQPGKLVQANTADVLQYDFACPTRSMFCGLQRGKHSDGWRDAELPRRIRYWVDELQVLLSLVQGGQALAYLPEFALREAGLTQVQVSDCPFQCRESIYLVWRPSLAAGWQAVVVDGLRQLEVASER